MRDDPVHQTLHTIAERLQDAGIPYAIVDGMALVAHGYQRTTEDVDVLVTAEGLARIHRELEGLGYLPPFAGSRNLRDASTGVRIEFLVAGHYPGDGRSKPVAFPDPNSASIEIDGIRYITLPALVELKLASGMTQPARRRDLADVQDLIRILKLDESFADSLDPYVRPMFLTLRNELRAAGAEEMP
ncbi:MAG: nucleotidyltransferase family protein [Phycisphaerae bacterium]|nr:nucleotidyltransferase family protein [Phycisphaerae bacterium]